MLPQPLDSFSHRDQSRLSKWLGSDDYSDKSKKVSWEVENGDEISTPTDKIPGWTNTRSHRQRNKWGGFTW